MATSRPKKGNWINPDVLRWARAWRGRTLEEAADKLNKTPEEIEAWESGESSPTVRQARVLAAFYGRPFLELVLPHPPNVPEPTVIPDYRMSRGERPPASDDRDVKIIQQWAETQRINALDLYEELGERPPNIPPWLFTTVGSDPEQAAAAARKALSFSLAEQTGLKRGNDSLLPAILRKKCEAVGVLTLRRPELKEFGVRGICLARFPLPVIVFTGEAPSAQAFTITHELAHILTKESGITGSRAPYRDQPVERWADHFAAAFLMPAECIETILGRPKPRAPAEEIRDEDLSRAADYFRVSPHAMLIRLVHLGWVQAAYYWEVKRPQFEEWEREHKSFARSTYYGSRYRSQYGDLYTGLVLEAWALGRITNHNAGEYLGIKNLNHLRDIRDKYGIP